MPPSSSRILSRHYFGYYVAIATYVAMFAGKFSVARLLPGSNLDGSSWGEFSVLASLVAAALLALKLAVERPIRIQATMVRVWRSIVLIAVAQLLLIAHVEFVSPAAPPKLFVTDLVTIIAVSAILGAAFQCWGIAFVSMLASVGLWIALVATVLIAATHLFGPLVEGERPLATTFTFYRLQLFGGFAALYLLFKCVDRRRQIALALAAVACFAAAYLSLSKAALLAGTFGLMLLACVLAIWFQRERGGLVAGVAVGSVAVFLLISGNLFVARFSEGVLGTGYSMNTDAVVRPVPAGGLVVASRKDELAALGGPSNRAVSSSLHATVANAMEVGQVVAKTGGNGTKNHAQQQVTATSSHSAVGQKATGRPATPAALASTAAVPSTPPIALAASHPQSGEGVGHLDQMLPAEQMVQARPQTSDDPIATQAQVESSVALIREKGPVTQEQARDFDAARRFSQIVACTAGRHACAIEAHRWEQDLANAMLQFHVFLPDYSFRIRLLIHGLRGFTQAPWFGNGFGSFHAVATNLYTKQPEPYFHPHNIIVELLFSIGIVGTVAISLILAALLWEILRTHSSIYYSLPLLSFAAAIIVGAVFGGDYLDFRLVWYGLVICVMAAPLQTRLPS